jgi:hypothetical protein
MTAYGIIIAIALLILKLRSRLKCVVNIMHRPLNHRLSLRYSLIRRLDGPQSLSGRCWRIENFLALIRITNQTVEPIT